MTMQCFKFYSIVYALKFYKEKKRFMLYELEKNNLKIDLQGDIDSE